MHCPKCGFQIESDDVSFCSKCGQTLGLVRAALAADSKPDASLEVHRGGVNLGVILMFVASLPAVVAVLTQSPSVPAAFLILLAGYFAAVLGSGPLMKAFRTDESAVSETRHRALRGEMVFGSTLMFLGIILAACLLMVLPREFEKFAMLLLPPATFVALLFTSGGIRRVFRDILGGESPSLAAAPQLELPQAPPVEDLTPLQIALGQGIRTGDLHPASITEHTTRHLNKDAADR